MYYSMIFNRCYYKISEFLEKKIEIEIKIISKSSFHARLFENFWLVGKYFLKRALKMAKNKINLDCNLWH